MSAIINGTPVNFGFQGTNGITVTGISGTLLQSVEHESMADCDVTRNGLGEEVTHGWHNYREEARLEWIVTGTSVGAAITNSALIAAGTFFVITACTSLPNLVATTWEAQSGCKVSGSNVNAKRMSVTIAKCAGITTSVATLS